MIRMIVAVRARMNGSAWQVEVLVELGGADVTGGHGIVEARTLK